MSILSKRFESSLKILELPKDPIDRYEVHFFAVRGEWSRSRVTEIRAVYHINSPWAEICPERADQQGAAFVDDWQIFSNGKFSGRNDRWDFYAKERDWTDCFSTREEAYTRALEKLCQAHAAKRKECEEIEERILELKIAQGKEDS